MKQVLTNPLYIVAVGVLALTLVSAGCQPTATYRGEEVTAAQLQERRLADLRKIETTLKMEKSKFDAKVIQLEAEAVEFDAKVIQLEADAVEIDADASAAASEIERERAIYGKVLSFVGDAIITTATGGTLNADDTLAGGLSLVAMLLGGGVVGQRLTKRAEDRGYDMGSAETVEKLQKAGAIQTPAGKDA